MDQTPLMVAVKAGYLEVVRLLRRAGAYLGLSPGDVGVRMAVAAGMGRNGVLTCLLEAGAGVNTVCPINGNTGLHSAVEGGHLHTVRLLLAQGADPNITNKYGLTPENILRSLNRDNMLELWGANLGTE